MKYVNAPNDAEPLEELRDNNIKSPDKILVLGTVIVPFTKVALPAKSVGEPALICNPFPDSEIFKLSPKVASPVTSKVANNPRAVVEVIFLQVTPLKIYKVGGDVLLSKYS